MPRLVPLFIGAVCFFSGIAGRGDDLSDPTPSTVATGSSNAYSQVTCSGTNPVVVADILQLGTDTRDQLGPLLRLGRTWRFPVHIRIVLPDDPLAAKVHHASTQAVVSGETMILEAMLPSSDLDAREFIQRQFVTALLWEKFFPPHQKFDSQTRLDVVPVWLAEGLREWLNDDSDHSRENIVKRAVQMQRTPALSDVTGWRELSDDRLLGLWQRAFCYYLVDSLIWKDLRRADFQQWLDSVSGPSPQSASLLFPTEMGWQNELVDAVGRSRDIVYTWDESAAEMAATDSITVSAKASADSSVSTLEKIGTFPPSQEVDAAVQKKIFDLTALELRVHPSWRPIFALYRFALSALVNQKNSAQAKKLFVQAREQRIAEVDRHQKLLDYVNWFEVTKNYSSSTSQFRSYFSTAQELERAQAEHPNPIRADLLHVESQL